MQVIETVSIDDVFPLEDEYGNDLARRDYTLKANKEYVRRLADSFDKETGRPDELVTLVRDGGIYRVKAGNSRVEAMRLLGTKTFPAIIDEDDTVQSCVEAAWRTDTKKTYEAEEKAEIFRALTLFGDDEYVAETTGTDIERARRIRRGAKHAEEAVDQMPLEWYEAVGEAEEAGDAEMVAALTVASASTWQSARRGLLGRRAEAGRADELREALAWAGIAVAEDGADRSDMRYVSTVATASDVKGREWPEGSVAYMQGGATAYVYVPAKGADPVAEERRRLMDETKAVREEWLSEAILGDLGQLAPLMELPGQCESPYWNVINSMLSHLVDDLPKVPADAVNSYMGSSTAPWYENGRGAYEPEAGKCRKFVALTDAMELCGYEPPEAEQRLYQMCVDAIGKEGTDE